MTGQVVQYGRLFGIKIQPGAFGVAHDPLAWFGTRPKPVEVTLAEVERGDVRATVANTRAGTVNACNRARMAPILGGLIAALPVSEGDQVEAG